MGSHELCLYLGISETGWIWVQVKLDPIYGPRQRESTNKQHRQHHIWKCGSKINYLQRRDDVAKL